MRSGIGMIKVRHSLLSLLGGWILDIVVRWCSSIRAVLLQNTTECNRLVAQFLKVSQRIGDKLLKFSPSGMSL
jgi:hypothetical protein